MDDFKEKVNQYIADSRLAFLNAQYDSSLLLANEALKIDRKSADAHQCAGNAYMSKADYQSAIEHYREAMTNDLDNGDRYFNLAYAFASDNQPVKALEMFAKADEIGCSPNVTGQLYKIMAMVCFDLHKYDDAILNFIKSEKLIGIDMDVLQRKSLSYSMSGDTASAIEVANQMKLLAPTEYLGYRIAFNVLLQEDRLDEAEKELDRAERFAKPSLELFFDWVSYKTAQFKLDNNPEHLEISLKKIFDGLCVLNPSVEEVVDSYINAAEIYVQLENADMAINCLNAAENPIASYNNGFSVIIVPEIEAKPVSRPSEREINHAIEAVRRKYGDRRLEAMGKEMTRSSRKNIPDEDKYLTPVVNDEEVHDIYKISSNEKVTYSQEKRDQMYRLYVASYTLKNDISHIKMYASKLANSQDIQSKYIGKYSLVKALKDEGYEKATDEYNDLLKYLRNAMIKDPSDLLALSFRVQCYVDLKQYDEAEKLCGLLSDDLKKPLMEQINTARSGGDK